MAKEKSSDVVDEAAEARREFDDLKSKVNQIHERLFKSEPEPSSKKTGEKQPPPEPKSDGFRAILEGMGILSAEKVEE